MPRLPFVLLEHSPPAEVDCGGGAAFPRHWDLMIAVEGREGLATWRLLRNPLEESGAIVAEPIGEHRREYLRFEGEVSGGRGRVRRLDEGYAAARTNADGEWEIALEGRGLRGDFRVLPVGGGGFEFRRSGC